MINIIIIRSSCGGGRWSEFFRNELFNDHSHYGLRWFRLTNEWQNHRCFFVLLGIANPTRTFRCQHRQQLLLLLLFSLKKLVENLQQNNVARECRVEHILNADILEKCNQSSKSLKKKNIDFKLLSRRKREESRCLLILKLSWICLQCWRDFAAKSKRQLVDPFANAIQIHRHFEH